MSYEHNKNLLGITAKWETFQLKKKASNQKPLLIPIAFNGKALHLSTFIVIIFFSDSVPCLHEIQSMKYLQLVLQMLPVLPKPLPAFSPGPPSFPCHRRIVLVLFNSGLLCFSPPFVFLPAFFLLPGLS